MIEAAGSDLYCLSDIGSWQQAAQSLASLQLESIGFSNPLLAAGCMDLRGPVLARSINAWQAALNELMAAQAVATPRPLTSAELELLAESLADACERLNAFPVADTLNHGDLNPGNILVSQNGAVFLDWAEASVGHPFLTLEYLVSLFRQLHPGEPDGCEVLAQSYFAVWTRLYPRQLFAETRRWTPLLALFAFSLNCLGWSEGVNHVSGTTGKLLRSVARRMHFVMLRLRAN